MNIDLILDSRANAAELQSQAMLAESLGFSGIWLSSLLDGRDPFANLVPAAAATRRIALGPIAVNPWDMHPVRIAAALHTLNELAGGRARIVVGGGGEALAALGLHPERRVRAVQECVEILRLASRGRRLDYEGQLYKARGFHLGWLSAAAPRVYVGANMEQMLKMSGRVADGVMLSDLPPDLAAAAIDCARRSAAASGRGADALWFSSFSAWHVYQDASKARDEARRWLLLRGLFRPWVLQQFLTPAETELVMSSQAAFAQAFAAGSARIEGIPDALADKLVDELSFTGSSKNLQPLVDRLLGYRAAGLSSVSLRLYADPETSMRLLAREVLPSLGK